MLGICCPLFSPTQTYLLDDGDEDGGYAAKAYTVGTSYADQAAMCQHEYSMLAKLSHINVVVAIGARFDDEDAGKLKKEGEKKKKKIIRNATSFQLKLYLICDWREDV